MKKYAFFALVVILFVLGGCRASDCGCPMSVTYPDEMQSRSHTTPC